VHRRIEDLNHRISDRDGMRNEHGVIEQARQALRDIGFSRACMAVHEDSFAGVERWSQPIEGCTVEHDLCKRSMHAVARDQPGVNRLRLYDV
jgi:hypothetical protein